MKRLSALLLIFCFVGLKSPSLTVAQTYADASEMLKEAAHVFIVDGDIYRAICLYRMVAESASAGREHVAQALVALGGSLELIGSNEAGIVYSRVVSEFFDQPKEFLMAREGLIRLSKLVPREEYIEPSVKQDCTLVMEEMRGLSSGTYYDFSPDGTTLVVQAPAPD